MEPPDSKKPKLETQESGTDVFQPSVRQQLRDLLAEVSAQSCGRSLPCEISDLIISNCLFSDFSELPDYVFDKEECEILGGLDEILNYEEDEKNSTVKDPLRKNQLTAIMNLPDKPLEVFGTELEEILDDGDIGFWWVHVGFPVGWKGSGELLEFDLWMCCEPGVFVFEKGGTEVLLRSEPKPEFCQAVRCPGRAKELSQLSASILWGVTERIIEPLDPKRLKLETQESGTDLSQPSVRQQLRDLLAEASVQSCGTSLPCEISDLIISKCLFRDFSELPDYVFDEDEYDTLGYLEELINEEDEKNSILKDHLRGDQLTAIMNLPDKPLEGWGTELEEIMENGDIGIWWVHVGFPVGWKGSGELLEFDLWMCCEPHHFHGVFVFEKGGTEVLLRSEPKPEFCQAVQCPGRAKRLSELSESILWRVTE